MGHLALVQASKAPLMGQGNARGNDPTQRRVSVEDTYTATEMHFGRPGSAFIVRHPLRRDSTREKG